MNKVVPTTAATTIFVYDAGGQLVAEYSTQISQTPQVSYLTSDHLGSPRVVTNGSGSVVSRKDFTAFGEETVTPQRISALGYKPQNIRQDYTGYQKDDESGLEFAQARYYNPAHGRFTTVDPLKESATSNSPQSWNRYAYTYNNPLNYVDPTGLVAMDDYYINRDGSWTVVETQCQCDTYNIETQAGSGESRARHTATKCCGVGRVSWRDGLLYKIRYE